MKFCTQCGKQLADGTVFCTSCGTKAESEAAKAPVANEPVTAPVNSEPVQAPVSEPVAPVSEPAPQPTSQPVAQPVNTGYEAPNAASAARQPKTVYTTNGWIVGLKIISWIIFAFCVIFGIGAGAALGYHETAIIFAFFGAIIGSIVGFMMVSISMVFLGIAQDLKRIRKDLEEIKQDIQ